MTGKTLVPQCRNNVYFEDLYVFLGNTYDKSFIFLVFVQVLSIALLNSTFPSYFSPARAVEHACKGLEHADKCGSSRRAWFFCEKVRSTLKGTFAYFSTSECENQSFKRKWRRCLSTAASHFRKFSGGLFGCCAQTPCSPPVVDSGLILVLSPCRSLLTSGRHCRHHQDFVISAALREVKQN